MFDILKLFEDIVKSITKNITSKESNHPKRPITNIQCKKGFRMKKQAPCISAPTTPLHFERKQKGGQYVIPAFFPNSLRVANSQRDKDTFWSLGFIMLYSPSRCFFLL